MRHRRRPLLSRRKSLHHFAHLSALEVPDLNGEAFYRPGGSRKRCHKVRVTIALHYLSRNGLRTKVELLHHKLLHARINAGVGSNSSRELPNGDIFDSSRQASVMTFHLGIPTSKLHTEGSWLSMDTMRATNTWGVTKLLRTRFERREQRLDIPLNEQPRASHLNRKAGINHIARGHSSMNVPGERPHVLGDVCEKRDDVVLYLGLDSEHPFNLKSRLVIEGFQSFGGRLTGCHHPLKRVPLNV